MLEPLCAHCIYNPIPPVNPRGWLTILAIPTFITRYSCVGKIPRDTLRCPRDPRQPIALEVLLTCLHYGWLHMPKYSSLTSIVLAILMWWKSSCVWMHQIIHWSLWNHSYGLDVIPDMSWISENRTFVDCPYKSVQLIYPWSEHLLLISPIGNQNSFELKRRIIWMLLSSDAFAWILSLVEYR